MNPLHALILGVIEGITEYLPVSSTGHLIIASSLLGLDQDETMREAVNAFNIVIQGGAILAVLGIYRAHVARMILGLLGRDRAGLRLFVNLCVGFLPAAVFGVLFDDVIEAKLFAPGPVVGALFVGGVLMIAIGPWQKRHVPKLESIDDVTWKHALFIGFVQCLAMWPGTSRSMVTIVGGMAAGLRPKQAADFAFLLGLPTLGGACVYKAMKSALGDGPDLVATIGTTSLIIGFAAATVSAAIAVKWLLGFLKQHGLAVFGWYRVALAIVLALLAWRGIVQF